MIKRLAKFVLEVELIMFNMLIQFSGLLISFIFFMDVLKRRFSKKKINCFGIDENYYAAPVDIEYFEGDE